MRINSFSPVAKAYTQKVSPGRFSQFLTLVHELALSGSERVLDIGAGPGILSMEIARQLDNGGFLSAIDLSPDMVSLARNTAELHGRNNIEFDHGDALNL
ncbi:MAG: class I SAM-dependent methyltransferase, partial [Candidatus Zixiibacteriota bacterium]